VIIMRKQMLTILLLTMMTGTCVFRLQQNISTRTLHASSNLTLYSNVQTFSTGLSGGPVVLDEPALTEMVGVVH
jgi:hypothetical protein